MDNSTLPVVLEEWKGRSILVVTPHPDDDTFCCGGTLAMLAANGNTIHILIYTSDNAGSNDIEMTPERLAAIRKKEEEDACAVLGIPAANIEWLGYDDGMLEYADRQKLTRQTARAIRKHRPDAVFTIDPGKVYDQWHKSDHRMAAQVGVDAMRAANWRLYFPKLAVEEGLEPWSVPVAYLYYSADPNVTLDITAVADQKALACAKHTSQFGRFVGKYEEAITDTDLKELIEEIKGNTLYLDREDGRCVERFRRSTEYGQ